MLRLLVYTDLCVNLETESDVNAFAEKLIPDNAPPGDFDQVLFLGRLTMSGTSSQFAMAGSVLDMVANHFFPGSNVPRAGIFVVPSLDEWKKDGCRAFLQEFFAEEKSGLACEPEAGVWMRLMTSATLVGFPHREEPKGLAGWFEDQMQGHSFHEYRPLLIVGGESLPSISDQPFLRKLVKQRLQIWSISPTGIRLTTEDGSREQNWERVERRGTFPIHVRTMATACEEHDEPPKWMVHKRAALDGKWEEPKVQSFNHLPEAASRHRATDDEAETYKPLINKLHERLTCGNKINRPSRIVFVRGLPGAGKKYLFNYLLARGEAPGNPILGWGDGDDGTTSVRTWGFEIENWEDADDFDTDLSIQRTLKALISEIKRFIETSHDDKSIALLAVYDHSIDNNFDNTSAGEESPQAKRRKAIIELICAELMKDLRHSDPGCDARWFVVFFNANSRFSLEKHYPDPTNVRCPQWIRQEWIFAGHPDVVERLTEAHKALAPVRVEDVKRLCGGYAKFCHRLLIESRHQFLSGCAQSSGPRSIGRRIVTQAFTESTWLARESSWFSINLQWLLSEGENSLELFKELQFAACKFWKSNDFEDPNVSLKFSMGYEKLLEDYGLATRAGNQWRLLAPLLLVGPATDSTPSHSMGLQP